MIKNSIVLWPKKIKNRHCSPNSLNNLKNLIQTKSITIIDKIKNTQDIIEIGGHINRSGKSFLVGNTPHGAKEQFPDMSNIYNNPNTKNITVHTIGKKRFSSKTKLNSNVVWSESIGLVSPVFSYLGYRVAGLGVPQHKISAINIERFIH